MFPYLLQLRRAEVACGHLYIFQVSLIVSLCIWRLMCVVWIQCSMQLSTFLYDIWPESNGQRTAGVSALWSFNPFPSKPSTMVELKRLSISALVYPNAIWPQATGKGRQGQRSISHLWLVQSISLWSWTHGSWEGLAFQLCYILMPSADKQRTGRGRQGPALYYLSYLWLVHSISLWSCTHHSWEDLTC